MRGFDTEDAVKILWSKNWTLTRSQQGKTKQIEPCYKMDSSLERLNIKLRQRSWNSLNSDSLNFQTKSFDFQFHRLAGHENILNLNSHEVNGSLIPNFTRKFKFKDKYDRSP